MGDCYVGITGYMSSALCILCWVSSPCPCVTAVRCHCAGVVLGCIAVAAAMMYCFVAAAVVPLDICSDVLSPWQPERDTLA
jgi:hypothetical protein